jgi:hypothetical protein
MHTSRYLVIAAVAAICFAAPAAAQVGPGAGGVQPAPGSGNSTAMVNNSREENASYNNVIGKVGADPVGKEKAKRAAMARAVPATAADIVPGAAVRDAKGVALGTIEKIDGDSAILVYSTGKIRYPLVGFGKDPQGLLISLSTQDFLALVSKASTGG